MMLRHREHSSSPTSMSPFSSTSPVSFPSRPQLFSLFQRGSGHRIMPSEVLEESPIVIKDVESGLPADRYFILLRSGMLYGYEGSYFPGADHVLKFDVDTASMGTHQLPILH